MKNKIIIMISLVFVIVLIAFAVYNRIQSDSKNFDRFSSVVVEEED